MSDKRLTTLRPSGWFFGTLDDGRVVEIESVQCVHCGGHFPLQPGSGKVRGYCVNCAGPVCGPQCAACIPTERLLEAMERGVRPEQMPVRVSAGGIALPPGVGS